MPTGNASTSRYLPTARRSAGSSCFAVTGGQREGGLGSASAVSLAQARSAAAEGVPCSPRGSIPSTQRRATSTAAATRKTFGECAAAFIASKRAEWRSAVTRPWHGRSGNYCAAISGPAGGHHRYAAVLSVPQPLGSIPETASTPPRAGSRPCSTYAEARGWERVRIPPHGAAIWR